ncbi:MAG: glycosyltransferase [Rhodospirillales bacterium]
MKYLWITWIDPEPEHDGQRIYSGRLIDAVAAAGAEIDVLCFESAKSQRRNGMLEGPVRWWPIARANRPGWASALSALPNMAYRCDTPAMRRMMRMLAAQGPWDTVVLDGLSTAWALPILTRFSAMTHNRPQIVYISHNHEESTRATIAENYSGNRLAKAFLKYDAAKTRRLEHRAIEHADLVTAITPEDAQLFKSRHPGKRIEVLSPGYAGQRVSERIITSTLPRRAVLVGSFEWIAKLMNLEEFLAVADPLFAAAGAEIQVIGAGHPDALTRMSQQLRATTFLGSVPAVEPYLADARIAVVPERTGGGFKLKILDYVFNRLPVFAISGSVAGTPLRVPENMLTFGSMEDLGRGVIEMIDDVPLLNRLQNTAYAACSNLFEWRQRGENFVAWTAAA